MFCDIIFQKSNCAVNSKQQGKANDKTRLANAGRAQGDFLESNDIVTLLDHTKDEQLEFKIVFIE
jgi:hypothetical protein